MPAALQKSTSKISTFFFSKILEPLLTSSESTETSLIFGKDPRFRSCFPWRKPVSLAVLESLHLMVSKTPFKVIHTSKTQFLEPNLVGFGRSIYVRRPWIKSGSKILEKKKVEIFEVDFCNAAGTRNTPLIILRLIFWWNVPYPTFFFQPCWSDYKGRDQAKKSGRLGVLEEVGGPTCWLSWRGKIVTIPKGPTAHQRLSNRPLPKGWKGRVSPPSQNS